jgi:hypothetical protein
MKKISLLALILGGTAGWLFAQGYVFSGTGPAYDPKTPPPLSLPEAYKLATAHLGARTNQFYCVKASCLERVQYAGWVFGFSSTNGQTAHLIVWFSKNVYEFQRAGDPWK